MTKKDKQIKLKDTFQNKIVQSEIKQDEWLLELVKKSDGKVDKYGIPKSVNWEEVEEVIILDEEIIDEIRTTILPVIEKEKQLTKEEQKEVLEYIIEKIPVIMQIIGEVLGDSFQEDIKPLAKVFTTSILKIFSAKKGKDYKSKRTKEIIKKLDKLWDDNLPLEDNQKSYFHKIAKEYGITYDAVRKIDKKYRP